MPLATVLALKGALGLTLSICGATGGLGRELCLQSVDRGWSTVALTRSTSARILLPNRRGGMADASTGENASPLLKAVHHDDAIALNASYDALVLALGGKPLTPDRTTRVVRALCANLPRRCTRVCLVSAYGVGSSLRNANAGIRVMESWYLQDVYAAKRKQEDLVRDLARIGVQTLILRPKALSYGRLTPFDAALPREELAASILEWCESGALTLG